MSESDVPDLTIRPPAIAPVEAESVAHSLEADAMQDKRSFDCQPPLGPWQRRLRLLSQFLAGQLAVQALNFAVGFFLLRWLNETAYAQYTVAFAFQSTVAMLVDLGFTGSIIALVGEDAEKPEVVGRYLRSARYFRTRSFVLIITGATVIYPFVVRQQPWGWEIKVLLYVGVAVALAADNFLMYTSVLFINRKLNLYYRAQIAGGLFRQAVCLIMHFTGTLNSWTASLAAAIATMINGQLYRRSALPLVQLPTKADPATNRRMFHYITPLMPGMIFAAFQGQISVVLITFFGKTKSIAEVGALGRLGQIFTLLSTFNQVIIEPFIARAARDSLFKKYVMVVCSQILIGILMTGGATILPGPLLWIIGPKYENLRSEIRWVALAASINYLCGGLWTMNSARKWIYWWGTFFYIVVIIGTQIIAALALDLSSTHDVVLFGVWTAAGLLVVHATHAIYGFVFGPAKRSELTAVIE